MTKTQSSNPKFKVLLYYKYLPIQNPEKFTQAHKEFCEKHNLLGRIIIAEEGISGTCAGTIEKVNSYIAYVHSLSGFEDVIFKEHLADSMPFKKLKIRLKKEIVVSRFKDIDLSKRGMYISPEEFNELYEKSKTDNSIVIFDVRNEIESKIGRFKNAITPKIRFFRHLQDILDSYEYLKDKKILLYCTGGIRCEKASSLMIQKGFENVHQLDGGIYNYCKKFPSGNFLGTCLVFDDRMHVYFDENGNAINSDKIPEEKIISYCDFCGIKCGRVVNDERKHERHLVVCCEGCDMKLDVSRVR